MTAVQEGKAFGPPGRHISERQRIQVASLDLGTAMSYQIGFQKARSGLIPLLEGADGNLLLEQGSGSRGGKAMLAQCALRTQETIDRRYAHGKQLASALIRDVKVFMSLQGFYQSREKRDEPFGTDAIGSVPEQEQRLLDFWAVGSHACPLARAARPQHG